MFSTRRRATASSSTIKMLAAMAFPGRYNYLSRIGALSLMPINTRLNLAVPPSQPFWLNTGSEQDDLALLIRSPQIDRSPPKYQEIRRQDQHRKAAGMEFGRPLFRHRRAGSHPRPRKDGRRMRRV